MDCIDSGKKVLGIMTSPFLFENSSSNIDPVDFWLIMTFRRTFLSVGGILEPIIVFDKASFPITF